MLSKTTHQLTILLFLLLSVLCLSCIEETKSKIPIEKEDKNANVKEYFNRQNWSYPINIDTSKMATIVIPRKVIHSELLTWVQNDSVIFKAFKEHAISIGEIKFLNYDQNQNAIKCVIDFYEDGVIRDGAALAIEGYSIIDNKLLRKRLRASFRIENNELEFERWIGQF